MQDCHKISPYCTALIDSDRTQHSSSSSTSAAAVTIKMAAVDKVAVFWIIAANLLAAGMMYQRLDKMGHLAPIKQQVAAVFEPVLEQLGLFHASYAPCGLQNGTMFILTSSRVVHPDGVRPGAGECVGGCASTQ